MNGNMAFKVIEILRKIDGNKLKSKLMARLKTQDWPGFRSEHFVAASRQYDEAFDFAARKNFLVYEKGKPLKLTDLGDDVLRAWLLLDEKLYGYDTNNQATQKGESKS